MQPEYYIPKIIWQTYKSQFPFKNSCESIKSWLNLNPDYQWYYMSDAMCDEFIADHFSDEFYQMYKSLPYGVMRADAWRIAIVYVYGGIYCDTDTVCLKPVDEWILNKKLVVSYEPRTANNIANFCFAAMPKHPALLLCLNQLLTNYNNSNFMDRLHKSGTPIQNYGQHAFNYGIKKYFNNNLVDVDNSTKIYTIEDNAFTSFPTKNSLVLHQVASIFWKNNYESWRQQQLTEFGY